MGSRCENIATPAIVLQESNVLAGSLAVWIDLTPRHCGNRVQPRNSLPAFFPLFTLRRIFRFPHVGQFGSDETRETVEDSLSRPVIGALMLKVERVAPTQSKPWILGGRTVSDARRSAQVDSRQYVEGMPSYPDVPTSCHAQIAGVPSGRLPITRSGHYLLATSGIVVRYAWLLITS